MGTRRSRQDGKDRSIGKGGKRDELESGEKRGDSRKPDGARRQTQEDGTSLVESPKRVRMAVGRSFDPLFPETVMH